MLKIGFGDELCVAFFAILALSAGLGLIFSDLAEVIKNCTEEGQNIRYNTQFEQRTVKKHIYNETMFFLLFFLFFDTLSGSNENVGKYFSELTFQDLIGLIIGIVFLFFIYNAVLYFCLQLWDAKKEKIKASTKKFNGNKSREMAWKMSNKFNNLKNKIKEEAEDWKDDYEYSDDSDYEYSDDTVADSSYDYEHKDDWNENNSDTSETVMMDKNDINSYSDTSNTSEIKIINQNETQDEPENRDNNDYKIYNQDNKTYNSDNRKYSSYNYNNEENRQNNNYNNAGRNENNTENNGNRRPPNKNFDWGNTSINFPPDNN